MTPPYRKKLIEVALPLEAINKESAREKSIRHGHPSTLHLWWARRPLAACRAVLFASLVDDPDSDPAFRKADGTVDEERAGVRRAELFNLIEELVKWENSNNESILNRARAEIAACVASRKILDTKEWKKEQVVVGEATERRSDKATKGSIASGTAWSFVCRTARPEHVNAFLAEHAPPVLDPFCGGGSIPLEAQRLGLRAYASDLNPVPVLITKALIEIPPKFAGRPPVNPESRGEAGPAGKKGGGKGKSVFETSQWRGAQGLAEDVRYYGKWMRDEAEKRIGHLYPKVKVTAEMAKDRPDLKPYSELNLPVIVWLWARTVTCPNPACRCAMPLLRSFELSKKAGKRTALIPEVDRSVHPPLVKFGITDAPTGDVSGTVKNRAVTCTACGGGTDLGYLRAEAQSGRMRVSLVAIVAEGHRGRVYLPAEADQERIAGSAMPTWKPEQKVTTPCHDVDRLPMYGMLTWGDAFTSRQLLALNTFSDLIADVRAKIVADSPKPAHCNGIDDIAPDADISYADAVSIYLSFLIDKLADLGNSLNRWEPVAQCPRQLFARQAISMVWDFAEGNPLGSSSGSWEVLLENLLRALCSPLMVHERLQAGYARQIEASVACSGITAPLISTDPPYYDNIAYADLSDFFYVWLRRNLSPVYPSLFSTVLTPKAQELVALPYRHEGSKEAAQRFFEDGFGKTFSNLRAGHNDEFPFTVFYAFKQAESQDADDGDNSGGSVASTGWETMLEGLIRADFSISSTWPTRTEMASRIIGQGTNVLASSVVLACRPRQANAPLATRREFLSALKQELPDALRRMQEGSVAPVDFAQASIGPGMAVFTRYAKVMEADGSPMKVRQALALINQTLDEVLAEQEGEFDGDTRWALAWFEQFGMEDGPFGVAETLSKAKNTAVNGLVEAGIVHSRAGKVRLLKRDELPADWNPATDTRLRHWEIVQYLIRALETGGESAAADLLRKLGGMGETARDLAYRLYSMCERKKWAADALAYNSLVIAWPEISKLARSAPRVVTKQAEMF